MTRVMGDATHSAVPQLAAIKSSLQLVAGYVTGGKNSSIEWTAADWAQFPGIPHVTIDQGFADSPNLSATVRDVEYGAWAPGQAVNRAGWNVPRPTIYCTTGETGYNLATVLADGWRGDVWLAIAGWQPGQPLPAAPGCTIVAVQNDYSNPNYDLSDVLDPAWPAVPGPAAQESDMLIIYGQSGKAYLLSGGKLHWIQDQASLEVYLAAGVPAPAGLAKVSAAEEAALLADFPAGEPSITVPPITVPPVTVTIPPLTLAGTITPS
jgi:hypothetical protein